MKTPLTVAMVAALAVALPGTLSAQGGEPGRSAVDLVIERLSDPSPQQAEAAMKSLVRGGPSSAAVLRKALEMCRDPAFVERARRALALCEFDAPAVEGLKVGLFADRTEVKPGEAIRLTARLCNVSDEQIVVYTGMSYSGSVFENGLALQRVEAGKEIPARFGAVGFCGTGARPLTVKLEPWTSREFEFEATYRDGPGPSQMIPSEAPRLVMGMTFLELGNKARFALRLRHAVRLEQVGGMARPEHEPDWQGSVRSNDVLLRIDV